MVNRHLQPLTPRRPLDPIVVDFRVHLAQGRSPRIAVTPEPTPPVQSCLPASATRPHRREGPALSEAVRPQSLAASAPRSPEPAINTLHALTPWERLRSFTQPHPRESTCPASGRHENSQTHSDVPYDDVSRCRRKPIVSHEVSRRDALILPPRQCPRIPIEFSDQILKYSFVFDPQ